MKYTIKRHDQALVVSIFGSLDVNTSPILEAALDEELDGITQLTLDLDSVDYISSMGLRLLLALQKRMFKQGSMCVTNVSEPIMELFVETGFSEIFTIL